MRLFLPFLLVLLAASPGFAATADKSYTNGNVSYTVQSTDTAWSQLLDIEGASSCAVQANLAATETFTLASRASGAVSPDDAATSLTITESGAYTFTPGTPFFSVKFNVLGDSNSIVGIVCDPAGGTDADLSMDLSTITFPAAGSSALGELTDVDLETAAPTTGQLLSWDGSNWVPATDADTIYDDTALQGQVDNIPVINALGDIAGVDTTGAVSGDVLSFNGTTWEDTAFATDAITGQTSGTLTGNVNGLTKIEFGDGYRDMIDATLASPKWAVATTLQPFFNVDGVKADCPTATLGADPAKPWYTCPTTGLLKTKTSGLYIEHINLSPSESWPLSIDLISGGDTDPNGMGIHVKASGGSQTVGDEGVNGARIAITPNWGNAFGTAAIPATTGEAVSIALTGGTEDNSKYIGVGKPLVFSGSAAAFTRTPNAQPSATVVVGSPKSGTAKVDWTVTSTVNGTGIEADNWCVYNEAYDYTTPGTGTTSHFWLKISAVAGDGLSFTTQWWSQGVDQKYPDSMLWSNAADSLHFAPCYTITGVGQDEATKFTNSVTVHKTSTYSEAGSIGWDVVPYGEFKMTGVKVLMTADVNPAGSGAAFTAQNELDFRGRHQINSAYKVEGPSCATDNRATSCLKDGTKGAFAYGLNMAEWGASTGIFYKYYQSGDLAASHKFAEIDPPAADNDWGAPYVGIPVIGVTGNTDLTLILDSARGWGQGQQGANLGYFAVVDGAVSHTNGNMLVWSDGDGAYIEAAQPTPANTSFSNFPVIGTSEAALFNGSSTIAAWNGSYTALAFAGASFTATLPEITSISDIHKRVEIWVQPGVTLTIQGHANDATALAFNVVTTGAGTASMTFTAPASDIACKVEVFVRGDNAVMTSSTCPTQTLSNP